MDRFPLVSVIVPAWNVAQYIGDTIRSVIEQTYENWELIVVNDGSPDSVELEKVLAPYLSRITYVVQPNSGVSIARNRGVQVSKGELVAFLDGDDWWYPEYLETQIQYLLRLGLDMVYCDAIIVGNVKSTGVRYSKGAPSMEPVTVASLITGRCNVITSGSVLKRSIFENVGGFAERRQRAEDFNLWVRLALAGARIGCNAVPLLNYRVRSGSLTGNSVQSAERAVEALSDLEPLELGIEDRKLLHQQLDRANFDLEVARAKSCLAARDYPGARKALKLALTGKFSAKHFTVLAMAYLTPSLLAKLVRNDDLRG